MKRKIKRFFKPNIINVSLSVICLGLTWKFIIPFMKYFKIVPCRLFTEIEGIWGFCPVDPTILQRTLYFGFSIGDHFYMILYLIVFGIIIPYTLSCTIFHIYYSYIKKLVLK